MNILLAINFFLTNAQLKNELEKCEFCEEKPCKTACPADCSAADFIMSARLLSASDIKRSACEIMKNNPLGGVCGLVCPDKFCMLSCVHKKFDQAVNIPAVQATIIQKAKELGGIPQFDKPNKAARLNSKKIAIIGAGPAGLSSAAVLAQKGYKVDIYEAANEPGGICTLIPDYRLPKNVLKSDIDFILSLGDINIKLNSRVDNPVDLLKGSNGEKYGYHAVLVAVGLWSPIKLNIKNEEYAITALEYLRNPAKYKFKSKVAVIGGGATAADCAITAKLYGAKQVEMFALETISEMPLTQCEREELLEYGIEITGRTRVTAIEVGGKKGSKRAKKISGLKTVKITLKKGDKFALDNLKDIIGTEQEQRYI
ncbi:MAG: FAD-dependent oxidoreductase [Elusimicrobiota bacterium]|nr:FAD-dependent oxidoreductase [Elusimicrobiota bacterium]